MLKRVNTCLCVFLAVVAWSAPAAGQIVNTLRGFDDKKMGWSGGLEGAAAIADGNTEYFEIEMVGAIQHQRERTRWRLLGRVLRRTASGEDVAQSRMAHLRHNFRIRPRLASLAFVQAQYDPFKRLKTRFLAGAGARYDLVDGVRWHTAVGAAAMYEHEELTGDLEEATDYLRGSFFLTIFRDVEDGVDIDVVGFYQPRLDDPSDARANVIAGLRADIVGELYAFVRYLAEYDTEPPAGVTNLDQNLRAGLGYKF